MQKSALFALIREEVTRALVFGFAFVTIVSVAFTGVAYAANGGAFGALLNQILASGNWEAPGDGTVKNATKLGLADAGTFAKVGTIRSCPANQCVDRLEANGDVHCH